MVDSSTVISRHDGEGYRRPPPTLQKVKARADVAMISIFSVTNSGDKERTKIDSESQQGLRTR